MTKEAIRDAVAEARRFIKKAEAVKFYSRVNREVAQVGKDAAAMRRASLDLTRALADMRKTPRC